MAETAPPREIADGTWLIDTEMFGVWQYGGVFYLEADEPALVETGTSLGRDHVLTALRDLGVGLETIHHVIVTHIHLDHAGGAGVLLPHLPNATVYVHERGYPHLAAPERLLASAQKALGAAFQVYGTLQPIPEDRMVAVRGGEVLDLGGRELEVLYTPGHARHHVALLDRGSRALYVGDAAGIYLREDQRLIPTTPFPEYDHPTSLDTLAALTRVNPRTVHYTHFGPRKDASRALREAEAEYARWHRRTAELLAAEDLEAATATLYEEWYPDIEGYSRFFIERIIETNLRGFRRFFERTEQDAAAKR